MPHMSNDEYAKEGTQEKGQDVTECYDDHYGHYEGNLEGHRLKPSENKPSVRPQGDPFKVG